LFITDRTNLVSTADCIVPCPIVMETNPLKIITGDWQLCCILWQRRLRR